MCNALNWRHYRHYLHVLEMHFDDSQFHCIYLNRKVKWKKNAALMISFSYQAILHNNCYSWATSLITKFTFILICRSVWRDRSEELQADGQSFRHKRFCHWSSQGASFSLCVCGLSANSRHLWKHNTQRWPETGWLCLSKFPNSHHSVSRWWNYFATKKLVPSVRRVFFIYVWFLWWRAWALRA